MTVSLTNPIRLLKKRLTRIELDARIACAFSRATATAASRAIDPRKPLTWEFGAFSQHGEDGIVDYLCSQVTSPNRFFFEIGGGDGVQNCTAWLAFGKGYGGVWVEGDPALCARARLALEGRVYHVHVVNRFVEPDSLSALLKMCPHQQPDVFSLDIDGIDYHVARRVLDLGFRPKIWVVEYNSAFGPDRAVTVPYRPAFTRWSDHPSGLYYGCSISGWRRLFGARDYQFVTVERAGCNAFFIDPACFQPDFWRALQGETFRDNEEDLNGATRPVPDANGDDELPLRDWRTQFPRIESLPLVEIA